MSNFNDRIRQVQVKNFTTTPQNLPEFQNPYLLVSKNKAYNKLATKQVLKKQKTNQNLNNPQIQNQNPNKITDDDAEDLARHVMSEVYRNRSDRREINGFKLSKSLSSEETVTYIGKNHILLGLRGSSNIKDYVADGEIAMKSLVGLPDALSNTLNNRYARDEEIYAKIRKKYPNKKIIMGGHSLGNALGMNILKNHKGDNNIKFFGYNPWIHQDYNEDSRAKRYNKEGDIVSTFLPTDSQIPLSTKGQIFTTGLGSSVAGVALKREMLKRQMVSLSAKMATSAEKRDFIQEQQENIRADMDGEEFAEMDEFRDSASGGIEEHFGLEPLEGVLDNSFYSNDDVLDIGENLYIEPYEQALLASYTSGNSMGLDDALDDLGIEPVHFDDIVMGADGNAETEIASEIAEQTAVEAGLEGLGLALSGGALLAGIAGAGYFLWSHSTNRFPIKNNRFKK
tara:strand:- start:97 stop:1458 length:1362 start_codon:yes stop_codon:yes gene_type:complete